MLRRLRRHFGADQGAFAFVEHVRNDAGHNASRTIDAMAMGLWPSRGLRLFAFEVKCSRADWLKEMRDPSKAEAFQPYVDYFYLVVSDEKFVREGELPETWGLMVPSGQGLRVVVSAPLAQRVRVLDRGMLAALLRRAELEGCAPHHEVEEAKRVAHREGMALGEQIAENKLMLLREEIAKLRAREEELVAHVGPEWRLVLRQQRPEFWVALRTALDGRRDLDGLRIRVQHLGEDAARLVEHAARLLEKYGTPGTEDPPDLR